MSDIGWVAVLLAFLHSYPGCRIRDIVLVADMTGTLTAPSSAGGGHTVTGKVASLLRRLLDLGAGLVINSGDSEPVITSTLLEPLAYQGTAPILVCSAGSQISVDESVEGKRRLRRLYQAPPIDRSVRVALLAAGRRVCSQVLGGRLTLAQGEMSELLSESGTRLDISGRLPSVSETALLELRAAKGLTYFFPQNPTSSGPVRQLIDALAADAGIQAIASSAGLTLTRGSNYFDAVLGDKGRISATLAQLPEAQQMFADRRVTLVAVDSRNDAALAAAYPDALKVFVGDAADFDVVTGGGPNAIHVPGFALGTEQFLTALLMHLDRPTTD